MRAREDLVTQIREDLRWLGLTWDDEVPRQSARTYDDALARLADHTYRCTCSRRDLAEHGGVYPGTCRSAGHREGAVRLRLPPGEVAFHDRARGAQRVDPSQFGDPILVRRDGLVAYNLAVVADDGRDGVTEVVRGADLLEFTAVQIVLHGLLGQRPPSWLHAPVLLGPDGRKLSKSHGSLEVAALREAGWTPPDVWRVVLPWLGMPGVTDLDAGARAFDPARLPPSPIQVPADLAVAADAARALTSPPAPPPK